MSAQSIVIIGLPGSGKTTFLAALWHLMTARDVNTVLQFGSLGIGDRSHLNAIAARWQEAKEQDRTAVGGNRRVSMNLKDATGAAVQVTFPDTAGEAYGRMWEERECDVDIAETLKVAGVMLFVHANTIQAPMWVVDDAVLARRMGIAIPGGQEIPWHPKLAPTQVQLVELLQHLSYAPLDIGPRRLAIMLSAWDKAAGEQLTPAQFLDAKLPLLAQYLRGNADRWDMRVYGLSAQGGDYDAVQADAAPRAEAAELRKLDQASKRIRLLGDGPETNDLTEPLAWLIA